MKNKKQTKQERKKLAKNLKQKQNANAKANAITKGANIMKLSNIKNIKNLKNKNEISFIFSVVFLIIDSLEDSISTFLTIDVKYYLIALIFINSFYSLYKYLTERGVINSGLIKSIAKDKAKDLTDLEDITEIEQEE